jgi:endoribonuclease Dicer
MDRKGRIDRPYQLEMFELAKKKNIIIGLPTGCGKTHIASLLFTHTAHELDGSFGTRPSDTAKRSFFLVPLKVLVPQQARELGDNTPFLDSEIGAYSGDDVDGLTNEEWTELLKRKKLIVLVHQIFRDLLTRDIIKLSQSSRSQHEEVGSTYVDVCILLLS